MKVEIEKENWSKESKKSLSYDFASKYYKDKKYKYYKCGKAETFSAKEQKVTYEIKKPIYGSRDVCVNSVMLISKN